MLQKRNKKKMGKKIQPMKHITDSIYEKQNLSTYSNTKKNSKYRFFYSIFLLPQCHNAKPIHEIQHRKTFLLNPWSQTKLCICTEKQEQNKRMNKILMEENKKCHKEEFSVGKSLIKIKKWGEILAHPWLHL